MKNLLTIIACVTVLQSCNLFKHEKSPVPYVIRFGSRGGFTGALDEYILKGSGILQKIDHFRGDTTILKTLTKKETSGIFEKVTSEQFSNIYLDQEGNLNYFLKLMEGQLLVKSWQWTEGTEVPTEMKTLYRELIGYTRPIR